MGGLQETNQGVRPLQVPLGAGAELVVARLVREDRDATAQRLPEDVIPAYLLARQQFGTAAVTTQYLDHLCPDDLANAVQAISL